jgi:hypothetical protein
MRSTIRKGMVAYPLVAAVGLLGTWFVQAARADIASERSGPPPGERGERREPPPFAFEACDEKAEAEACSVQFHDRELTGTCTTFSDERLFCRPNAPPPPPPGAREKQGPTA